MTQFYLIMYGQTYNKTYYEREFASLSVKGISQILATASDARLKDAEIIVSAPYNSAIQTASIISKEINVKTIIELGLDEWMYDQTSQYDKLQESTPKEILELSNDFDYYKSNKNREETRKIEDLFTFKNRIKNVINKYKNYNKVIIICDKMAIRALTYVKKIEHGKVIEYSS